MSEVDATRRAVAEFVGTFALVVTVVGTVAVFADLGLLGAALGQGLILAAMITGLARISGAHFNPAVTVAVLLTRRIEPVLAGVYVLAQLAGAVAAALVMDLLYPARFDAQLEGSAPAISTESGFSAGSGMLLEALLTFFLVWVIFAVAVDRKQTVGALAGLMIGVTVVADILLGGLITGAAMNPARAFGPQLVFGQWDDAWIYYVGPLAGAAVAALLYTFLYAPAREPETASLAHRE